jgi:spore coat protein U-like protein
MPPGKHQVAEMKVVRSTSIFTSIALAALCAAAGLAPSAIAGEASQQLRVSVTIVASCRFTVDQATLSFGDVAQDAGSATAQTNLGVRCSSKQPYAIGFDYGEHAEGGQRQLSDGSNGIAYQLYADASHRTPLGPHGSTGEVRGTGNGDEQVVPVYGKLDLAHDTPPGVYNDTVRLTVTW